MSEIEKIRTDLVKWEETINIFKIDENFWTGLEKETVKRIEDLVTMTDEMNSNILLGKDMKNEFDYRFSNIKGLQLNVLNPQEKKQ